MGSRRADVVPAKSANPSNLKSETTELFVAGSLQDFQTFSNAFSQGLPRLKQGKHYLVQYLESISNPNPLKNSNFLEFAENSTEIFPFESILHVERGRFEALVADGSWSIIRRRQTLDDVLALET